MIPTEAAIEAWIEGIIDRVLRPIIRDEIRAVMRELGEPHEAADEWLDSSAAAQVLGVHRKTIERMARSGDLKSARVGRCLRFRRSDINAYLEGGDAFQLCPASD